MDEEDPDRVLVIYAEGIEDGLATLETRCSSCEEWDATHHTECRLVADEDGTIVGWAALNPVSERACYRGVAEISVYGARGARGRGVGLALLDALVRESERAGFWTLQGATFEDNTASMRLQERCGFRVVGTRERIARLNDQWKTTVLTERRSEVVGLDHWDGEPEPRQTQHPRRPPA